jgi:hypothetical protein
VRLNSQRGKKYLLQLKHSLKISKRQGWSGMVIQPALIVYLRSSLFTITKFAYRNRQPSGGRIPFGGFLLCKKAYKRMYKLLNPDAVLIPRKPV